MSQYQSKKIPAKVILWGGTGQAKTVRPIIEHYGAKVVAVFDDTVDLMPPFSDVELYCGWSAFTDWIASRRAEDIGFCIAIGNPHGRVRLKLHDMLVAEGLKPVTVVHPRAWIADSAHIGEGSQILAGAIIADEVRMGRQCLIDSNALVEHETILEDAVEIAPSATVLGLTRIGVNSQIGAGATVLSRLCIGADVTVGAGSVVASDVPDKETICTGSTKRPV